VCVGLAASGGAWLLSSGTKGKRFVLPHAEVMIHQPLGGAEGQTTDILITAEQYRKHREILAEMMAKNCGQSKEKVLKDLERDYWMSAEEAKKYGIVDDILKPKKK
jgi:ATP-dependent Clp protease protease subunit